MRSKGWSFEQWFVYGGTAMVAAVYAVVSIAAMHADGLI